MGEAVPMKAEPCARCQGEGFVFQVRDGKALAEACDCTRGCARCGGSGRAYEKDERGYEMLRGCACGADPRRLALLSGLRLPLKYLGTTLQSFKPNHQTHMRALARADRFVQEFVPGNSTRGLVFCGPPGTGKTHLLCAILRALAAKKAVRSRYEEFFLLLSDVRDGFSNNVSSRQWLEPLRHVDVLAIDELGKGGKNREFEQGVLDEIISIRYNAGRPTLFATNYPSATAEWKSNVTGEVRETLEQRVGARVFSRLHEMCDFVEVLGEDQRRGQHDVRAAKDDTRSAAGWSRPARG